ncbi:MAG: radical SAM protein, partial [Planctomycetales bacterium]|nr:radical SAM protein [Planctomycetales bacterium]
DEYFRRIDRTSIPFSRVLENIRDAARRWPLVIQSLFMRVAAESPTAAELDAYCDRLNEVTAAGGDLKLIQIYTIARRPAESFVTPLRDGEVDALAELVERRTGLKVARYYGAAN